MHSHSNVSRIQSHVFIRREFCVRCCRRCCRHCVECARMPCSILLCAEQTAKDHFIRCCMRSQIDPSTVLHTLCNMHVIVYLIHVPSMWLMSWMLWAKEGSINKKGAFNMSETECGSRMSQMKSIHCAPKWWVRNNNVLRHGTYGCVLCAVWCGMAWPLYTYIATMAIKFMA